MKNLILLIVLAIPWQTALSQDPEYDHLDGGEFTKTVEFNVSWRGLEEGEVGMYNFSGKPILDRMFFGKINSPVEYVCDSSSEDATALRLIQDSTTRAYLIEVMWLPHSYEVLQEVAKVSEQMETYPVERRLFGIRDQFAEYLQAKMTSLIGGFRAEGIPVIIFGGYTSTFRCVVGDELWTLTIHEPQRRALQMSNLCRQMIEDARDGSFDEWKYVRMLEPIEF